jgi:NAD(P)H dehydrogenase (quinone)
MKTLILFYSSYGHVYRMAVSAAEGVKDAGGEAVLRKVPETLSEEVLQKTGSLDFQRSIADIPVCSLSDLESADAVLFGAPTRFGSVCSQMRAFLDSTGGLWMKGSLAGKFGGVFTSSATQHGGQESTILSMHITLLHHGMLIAGLPYLYKDQTGQDVIAGCSPYGASTIAGSNGEKTPNEIELKGARFQGKYITLFAKETGKARDAILRSIT